RARRCAEFRDRLLLQRRGRTGLHAGTAAHTVRREEVVAGNPRRDPAVEAASLDGQGEGALHLLAGPHAARADDAFLRIVAEVGIAVVPRDVERVARIASGSACTEIACC